MTKKLNILITGVAGLVGSNLAEELKDHNIIGIDNLISGYLDNIPEHVSWINDDCNNLTSSVFENIDVVIHAACTPYEGVSVFSPKFITDNTFGMSMNVLKCAIQANVKKFIFFSSMARYGEQDVLPFTENMIPKPQDPYGISKLAFEENLKMLSKAHNFNYVIIVPHNIIGKNQIYTDPYRNVASIMINRMAQDMQPIIYGDGLQKRCFSDIRDVISPLRLMVETDIANNEIINIGPDIDFISINELAEKISNILNFKLDPIYLPDRPFEVKYANCSADKARSLLSYTPIFSIDQTLEDMAKWIMKRGPKPFNFHLPIEIVNNSIPSIWKNGI